MPLEMAAPAEAVSSVKFSWREYDAQWVFYKEKKHTMGIFFSEGTGDEFQRRRKALGLRTQEIAAPVFSVTKAGLAKWEAEVRSVPDYAWRLLWLYEQGARPPDWPALHS